MKLILLTLFLFTLSASMPVSANLTNNGVLDQVVSKFSDRATAWEEPVGSAASYLFWLLGALALVWRMKDLVLTKADMADFIKEYIAFALPFGFFYWVLENGPEFAKSIIDSLRQIGDEAAGTSGLTPSSLVDIGFEVLFRILDNLSLADPIDGIAAMAIGIAILLMIATIAVNMVILLVTAWVLMYAGIFFLGFGGSSWTSDMAINYYKTVLGIAAQLFTMILLVGIGTDLLDSFFASMSENPKYEELATMLIASFTLMKLTNKVPPLVAGIASGGGGGSGVSGVSPGTVAGAAMAGAAMAGAAMAAGGSAMLSGATNVAGAVDAVKAASESGGGEDRGSSMMNTAGTSPKESGFDALSEAMSDNDTGSQGGSMGSRLASGIKSVASDKKKEASDKKKEAVSKTIGGKIATAIRAADSAAKAAAEKAAEEEDNTLSTGAPEQPSPMDQSEIDDFVNKSS